MMRDATDTPVQCNAGLDSAYADAAHAWLESQGWPVVRIRIRVRLRVAGRERTVILGPCRLKDRVIVMDGRASIRSLIGRPTARIIPFPSSPRETSR
jgi:hypothetical protein